MPIFCPSRHSHDTVFLGPKGQSAGQARGCLWRPRFPRSFESAVSFSPLHSFFRRTQVSPVIPLSVPDSFKQYGRGGHPPLGGTEDTSRTRRLLPLGLTHGWWVSRGADGRVLGTPSPSSPFCPLFHLQVMPSGALHPPELFSAPGWRGPTHLHHPRPQQPTILSLGAGWTLCPCLTPAPPPQPGTRPTFPGILISESLSGEPKPRQVYAVNALSVPSPRPQASPQKQPLRRSR